MSQLSAMRKDESGTGPVLLGLMYLSDSLRPEYGGRVHSHLNSVNKHKIRQNRAVGEDKSGRTCENLNPVW